MRGSTINPFEMLNTSTMRKGCYAAGQDLSHRITLGVCGGNCSDVHIQPEPFIREPVTQTWTSRKDHKCHSRQR